MSEKQTPLSASNFLYSVLPGTLVEQTKPRAQGPDLSHWSGYYEPNIATQKADFVITKASEGYQWIDPALEEIWEGMRQIAIRGLYHYQRSGMSWSAQATHFLNTVTPLDHHFIALDVEGINNTVNVTFIQDTYRILNYLEQNTNVKVILYTNPTIFQNYIYPIWVQYFGEAGRQKALTIPLWLAQYWNTRSPNKNPGMPKQRPLPSWDIYQWTDRGVGAEWGTQELGVDLNVFNGPVESMRLWLGLSESFTEPIPEEPSIELPSDPIPEQEVWIGKVVSSTRMRVRTFPEVSSDTTVSNLYLYLGNIVEGRLWSGNGYVWMKITTLNQPYTGLWVAVSTLDGTKKYLSLNRR